MGPALSGGVKQLEEVVYEIARDALADQERLVAGIRLRTGTLVAAHALVASFLGATVIRESALGSAGWVALAALATALVLAAVVLAPWHLDFALNARTVYDRLVLETDEDQRLLAAAFYHDAARERNDAVARRLRWASGGVAVLLVVQTLAWMIGLG